MAAWLPWLPAPLPFRPPIAASVVGGRDLRSTASRRRFQPISSRSVPRPSRTAPRTAPNRTTWKSSATRSRSARSSPRSSRRRRSGATAALLDDRPPMVDCPRNPGCVDPPAKRCTRPTCYTKPRRLAIRRRHGRDRLPRLDVVDRPAIAPIPDDGRELMSG